MKYIYIYQVSNYSEATEATFIHTNAEIVTDFLFQSFCDGKIQQICKKEKCS